MKVYLVAEDDIVTEFEYHDWKIFLSEDQAKNYFDSLEWNKCTDIQVLEVEPEPVTPIVFSPSKYKCSICGTPYPGSFDLIKRANKYMAEYFCENCMRITLIEEELSKREM